jgi:SAM-dependent methyltransferase
MTNLPAVFKKARKHWGGNGSGSTEEKTLVLQYQLEKLLGELKVETLLDVGCGTFDWLAPLISANPVEYIGVDVAADAIAVNREKFPDLRFEAITSFEDELPKADLIICRDVIAHLCNHDVAQLIKQMCAASKWLLITSHQTRRNSDIRTGGFHPLNLLERPFRFPRPDRFLEDSDRKQMALWSTDKLG